MDRRGRHVIYFALQPAPAAARAALALAEHVRARRGLAGRPTVEARLHVSLNFVGVFECTPVQVVDAARRAADRVAAAPFTVAFNRVGTWGRGTGPRPIVLSGDEGMIGAEALHDRIHAQLAAAGMAHGPPRPIWPHLTLLRDRIEIQPETVPPIAWRVDEFVLFDALHGHGRRAVLGVWPLSG